MCAPSILAEENVGVDPVNVGWSADLIDGLPTRVVQRVIPAEEFGDRPIYAVKPTSEKEGNPPEKLHPELVPMIKSRSADELVEVIVVFEEDTRIPPMPVLDSSLPREDAKNAARLNDIQAIIGAVKAERVLTQEAKISMLARNFGGRTIDSFWLINGILVELPLSAMNELVRRPEVLSIEPKQKTVPPPTHGTANHVSNARARINTDPYFNAMGGFFGLLDTGVRPTHSLLIGPDRISLERDCTGGDNNGLCNSLPNPQDDFWNHGVSSAAILSGNGNMSNTFRGVTSITVDSFKIYTSGGLDTAAAITGFQHAIELLVIELL